MSIAISIEQLIATPKNPENILARFVFGSNQLDADHDFETGMPLLDTEQRCEIWRVGERVTRKNVGLARLAISDHYCLAAVEIPVEMAKLAEVSKLAYDQIFDAIQGHRFSHVVKTWNYVPDINGGGEDDREYYKQFCLGRGDSFAEKGLTNDCMPAGTAVGVSSAEPLRVFVLSSNHEVLRIENPRQTSAYRYPRQYGPKSPSFSRAVCLASDRFSQFFLSGTASITGHTSRHLGLVEEQTLETIENIAVLVDAANVKNPFDGFALDGGIFRVHLKDAGELARVTGALKRRGIDPSRMIAVKADVCRRELLVEIDGLFDAAQQGD